MLRFPLRLTAELARARLAQKLQPALSAVRFVDAAELLHHHANHPISHERIREIISSRSPVVWIGGSEPLDHPGVAHLVRAITGSGHFVFLETDGTTLRRRIHEFQPLPRFFLTVRWDAGARLPASKSLPPSPSELAAEGVRAAQLSGFLICFHARVHAQTELAAMAELMQYAHSLDVDGIVVSPGSAGSQRPVPDAAALQRKTAEARKLIGSKWWEFFSRLIEPVVNGERRALESPDESAARVEPEVPASGEGVRVA
jgi:hypothetical protein